MRSEVVLDEAGPPQLVDLTLPQLVELQRLGVCDVHAGPVPGEWRATRIRKVGVVRLDDMQVRVRPKVGVDQLLVLLMFGDGLVRWLDDEVSASDDSSVTEALVRIYTRLLARATEQGLLRAYHEVEQATQVVRGRWDVTRQITRHQGVRLPLEVTVDEFDVDTAPNQILLAAALRLLRLPGVSSGAARRLRSLVPRFEGVSLLRPGSALPRWEASSRERRLLPAVQMARLIIEGRGVAESMGKASGATFLVTMSSLFERVIEHGLRQAARAHGLHVPAQRNHPLDDGGRVVVRPDIVIKRGETVVAVADAKYKIEQPSGYPNADVYQALVYARRFGLSTAHLLYAKGEAAAERIEVPSVGVTVHRRVVDMSLPVNELQAQLVGLHESMVYA